MGEMNIFNNPFRDEINLGIKAAKTAHEICAVNEEGAMLQRCIHR